MMRIVFLGTNGWFDNECGHTLSILVETEDFQLVLDAGSGFALLDRYATIDRRFLLFLSHYHLDHLYGMHAISKFRFPAGLDILGQKNVRYDLGQLMRQPYTMSLEQAGIEVRYHELDGACAGLPFDWQVRSMVHASPTIGLRVEYKGLVLAFCPDTGYCQGCVDLARDADIVITECAFRSGHESSSWPHLNPQSAARIATEAGARRLVLTHFDPLHYPDLKAREDAGHDARTIFANTDVSYDGLEIRLG